MTAKRNDKKMKGLKILHIAPYCSARTFKQIIEQQDAGADVTLIYGMTGHGDLLDMVHRYRGWCSDAEFESITGFDVCVLHTTVSTFGHAIHMPLPKDCRLVWDCHDYVSSDPEWGFDAVVCPSAGMAEKFKNGHVVYSKVPMCLQPKIQKKPKYPNTAVLAATIGNGKAWSDYSGISDRLGMPVIIYPSSNKFSGHEDEIVAQHLPYLHLLYMMTQFEYGYAGAANPGVTINDCVTNKFWEYIACGCKVLTFQSDEMTRLLSIEETLGDHVYMESELDKMKKAYGA
jgi:hypothetical protein